MPVLINCTGDLGVGLFALRRWLAGGVCRSKARLDGKTVLITGANTGIGKETAVDMAKRGARVILACRDMGRANKAAEEVRKRSGNDNVVVKMLDLNSLRSVRALAKDVQKTEDRLNILINNAGIMMCPHWRTEDGFEMQFGVNHLGHFLLTNLLLDLLKKSAPSRIVNVSSLAHESGKIHFDDINLEKNYETLGAQTTIYCAVDESLKNTSGLYYSDCALKEAAPQARDDAAARRLWNLSASMVGLA
ncbi:retinol dehydrogenase 13-like protein [Labeo rohita]|uniref:Retinol dehydrogenase 13-like protein n=1 Tax=Labeo rohita TaxID=84645 RepID=A0A498L7A1_LABRO|nr:retinol dehydrogenase 13-like protein [Labeo rohita]